MCVKKIYLKKRREGSWIYKTMESCRDNNGLAWNLASFFLVTPTTAGLVSLVTKVEYFKSSLILSDFDWFPTFLKLIHHSQYMAKPATKPTILCDILNADGVPVKMDMNTIDECVRYILGKKRKERSLSYSKLVIPCSNHLHWFVSNVQLWLSYSWKL